MQRERENSSKQQKKLEEVSKISVYSQIIPLQMPVTQRKRPLKSKPPRKTLHHSLMTDDLKTASEKINIWQGEAPTELAWKTPGIAVNRTPAALPCLVVVPGKEPEQ
ncbi:Protein Transport Protein Sec23B [Manis pentadactyla]|nr:Protein Transport Protein Sec23B [Manis pentadactyla]